MTGRVGRALRRVALTARRTGWRVQDYAYVVHRQAAGLALLVRRGGADAWLEPEHRTGPDVVLVPGVYEPWAFLAPLADTLYRHGHPVHALPALGYNSGPIPLAAARLGAYLRDRDLRDVVVVAHSKGGLIGKLAMLREDPDCRIRGLVAVATPFAGSSLARFVPLPAVRAFVPTDATLVSLAAERDVNTHVTSVYGPWDPHIPAGSVLPGAHNVELGTAGHFRVLADVDLPGVVLDALTSPGTAGARGPGASTCGHGEAVDPGRQPMRGAEEPPPTRSPR